MSAENTKNRGIIRTILTFVASVLIMFPIALMGDACQTVANLCDRFVQWWIKTF